MNYKNDKLNISIENSNIFDEVEENDDCVSLIVDGVEKFSGLDNSRMWFVTYEDYSGGKYSAPLVYFPSKRTPYHFHFMPSCYKNTEYKKITIEPKEY